MVFHHLQPKKWTAPATKEETACEQSCYYQNVNVANERLAIFCLSFFWSIASIQGITIAQPPDTRPNSVLNRRGVGDPRSARRSLSRSCCFNETGVCFLRRAWASCKFATCNSRQYNDQNLANTWAHAVTLNRVTYLKLDFEHLVFFFQMTKVFTIPN